MLRSRLFKGLVPNAREVPGTCEGGLGAPWSGSSRGALVLGTGEVGLEDPGSGNRLSIL